MIRPLARLELQAAARVLPLWNATTDLLSVQTINLDLKLSLLLTDFNLDGNADCAIVVCSISSLYGYDIRKRGWNKDHD